MALRLKNTKSNKLEEFQPLTEGKVRMYVCGPTVYNYFHIGNARPFIVFDVIRRYLIFKGYEVTYAQNITDIDDKLINQAKAENKTVKEIADFYTTAYLEDLSHLNVLPANHNPKATESISWIIDLIQKLEAKGFTYKVDDKNAGGIYFKVMNFDKYTQLSGMQLEKLQLGASGRIDDDLRSKLESPFDFALWKFQKESSEPAWDSPWGLGRPGWHIECSAMSMNLLGESFDIHGGGEDLIFPHHENEIAQAEAATGKTFVKYWLHNGFIKMGDDKMSKSLGNVKLVREIIKDDFSGQDLRFFMLQAHYRGPITFTFEILEEAKTARKKFINAYKTLSDALNSADETKYEKEYDIEVERIRQEFLDAMDDDFNTTHALGKLFELVNLSNRLINQENVHAKSLLESLKKNFDQFAQIFGLICSEEKSEELTAEETDLLDARIKARAEMNWAESDRLRDVLKDMGIIIKDTKDGQKWTRGI